MPMLDHVEELRRRLFWIVGAVAAASAVAQFVVFTFPVILWPAWAFVRPAMTATERRTSRFAIAGSIVLFMSGVALAWGVVLPLAVQWLMGLQTDALTPVITAREYFSFAVDMALAFGVSFQLPVVIVALVWLGIVTPERLATFRRAALFGSVVIGAVLTPGDLVWTTLAMAVPLYGLYELSVIVSRRVVRMR
ncbi:MAG: Sec-independent protein translocase, TatC subunit [Gemmatimonadetes bacterium]|nr:Sec-independent protein translocase, TatC subunit [Gemmatimonadota bacterium]